MSSNVGRVYAQYINSFVDTPLQLWDAEQRKLSARNTERRDDGPHLVRHIDNARRDVVDAVAAGLTTHNKYGPARYDPLLPGLRFTKVWTLRSDLQASDLSSADVISWSIYADSAPVREGSIALTGIPFHPIDKTTMGESAPDALMRKRILSKVPR